MTVKDLCEGLELLPLTGDSAYSNEVEGCYVGDLLSWVMGRAGENNVWVTVMGNVNAIAVAKLADLSCIILCDGSPLDEEAKSSAITNGIGIFSSSLPAYELAIKISSLL